jgi:hypothetical protein
MGFARPIGGFFGSPSVISENGQIYRNHFQDKANAIVTHRYKRSKAFQGKPEALQE